MTRDRHFLDLSETCLYIVHFYLGPFLRKSQTKYCSHSFTINVNQKWAVVEILFRFNIQLVGIKTTPKGSLRVKYWYSKNVSQN